MRYSLRYVLLTLMMLCLQTCNAYCVFDHCNSWCQAKGHRFGNCVPIAAPVMERNCVCLGPIGNYPRD